MNLDELFNQIIDFAKTCGMEQKTSGHPKGNAIVRDNATGKTTDAEAFKKGAYFGFVREDEDYIGGYHDFSLVFFPQIDGEACVVALGVGSLGFANDYDIASLPWVRRMFLELHREGSKTYFKNDFSDIDSPALGLSEEINCNYSNLKTVIEKYKPFLPAAEILDYSDKSLDNDNFTVIKRWIATYAGLRNWAKNDKERNTIIDNLPKATKKILSPDQIGDILYRDRFVVLQGAPGTGKTFSALEIANNYKREGKLFFEKVFFEQFHAETSYSDFIYGIRPKLDTTSLAYEEKKGILYKTIEYALEPENKDKNVLLIIDEINRANLSSVLGPVFYLFEKDQSNHNYEIVISENLSLEKLPENLFVLATMNTADRSLAVVDFALRRRFTWLTLKPHPIDPREGKTFFDKYFMAIEKLFKKYASDEELNLQPGQSYFIAKDEIEMKERLRYEIMPLIKEYLNEGYLKKASDEFSNYFYNTIGELIYE